MEKQDIPFLTTAELGELIRTREVSPVEATAAYLDRIDSLNFKFNSYLTVCRSEAMAAAGEAERAIARGDYQGPCTAFQWRSRTRSGHRESGPPSARGSWPTTSPRRTPPPLPS